MIIPDWAAPLVTRARNAIIEKPGDIDCVAVVAAVLEGLGEVGIDHITVDAAIYEAQEGGHRSLLEEAAAAYGVISRTLAKELRSAR